MNATLTEVASEGLLHQVFMEQARRTPAAVAVVWKDRELTYHQLDLLSDQIAKQLLASGVGEGKWVGVCCSRKLEMPALLLGVLKSGAAYVPLDPEYPIARLQEMANDSEMSLVLTNRDQASLVQSFNLPAIFAEDIIETDNAYPLDDRIQREFIAPGRLATDSPAYMIYTSGSTGKPKGVVISHHAVVNLLLSLQHEPGFTAQDRILATTTLSFDISVLEMFLPLVCGGSLAIVDRTTAKDSAELVAAIRRHKITVMQATPAMWRMILENGFVGGPHLTFFSGGEPLPRDLLQNMLPRCKQVWNMYGPTEATVYASIMRLTDPNQRILIGSPVANTTMMVVDSENRLCPPETPGELLIGGAQLAIQYHNRPELTAEKFIWLNGARYYRTGDLAQITVDGRIDHLGRIDSQIKLHGHRIELGEIESVLTRQPGIRRAAVVLREDIPNNPRLVGYVVLEANARFVWPQLRQSLQRTLPDYMVPSIVVPMDQFYYTPSGKLDRNSFQPPEFDRSCLSSVFIPAQSTTERRVVAIWESILEVTPIGMEDNFFELGGNSILAATFLHQLNTELQLQLSSAKFFNRPTIRGSLQEAERLTNDRQFSRQSAHETSPQACRAAISQKSTGSKAYAIVGMSARFPGAKDLQQYWQNLLQGIESITCFAPADLDPSLDSNLTSNPNYVAARGVLEDADQFDAAFFAEAPTSAALIDPQQRVMLEVAYHAIEDAGIRLDLQPGKIGVWAGCYSTTYHHKNILSNPQLVEEKSEFQLGIGNEKDYVASRIAYKLNLTGPAVNVNSACSTSLVAVTEACNSLELGYCDVAIAGACSIHFPQSSGHLHQSGSIFTPDGHCRPFDADGAGTLFSDGAGAVVLKRLEDAQRDGDRIYATIRGLGVNNDGSEKASFSAPTISGQADAISMALQQAGFSPRSIGYIEAHGTATPVGDPIEVAALQSVFESTTKDRQFCAIGSVKSNIGHCVAAAGMAGLIKTALALHYQVIPRTLHYQKPFAEIDFTASPFFVCSRNLEWKANSQAEFPRRAGISSFGVGGTNAHVVLEEAPRNESSLIGENDGSILSDEKGCPSSFFTPVCWPISAKSEGALDQQLQRFAELCHDAENSMHDIAYTLQVGRSEMSWRATVVGRSLDEMRQKLNGENSSGLYRRHASSVSPPVVFMFPGQGAQYLNMGRSLYERSPEFKKRFDNCCDYLIPKLDCDLRTVLFGDCQGTQQQEQILRATRLTQPALFSVGYALARTFQHWGIEPTAMLGHSIGEFVAACLGGIFSLEDALDLIAQRGNLMQALPSGSMLSVRLPGAQVERLLSGALAIAAFNGPKLCVVAGPDDQMAAFQAELQSRGIICQPLHTSHAFHSPMMDPVVEPFRKLVKDKRRSASQIPILSTVTGRWLTDQQATDPNYWAEHLRQPVRFTDATAAIWHQTPEAILLELGPRRTLATLAKQHAADSVKRMAIATLADGRDLASELTSIAEALCQLWCCGVSIDWQRIGLFQSGGQQARPAKVSLPGYPFQRTRHFIDPPALRTCRETPPHKQPGIASGPTATVEDHRCPAESEVRSTLRKGRKMSRNTSIDHIVRKIFEDASGFEMQTVAPETSFFEIGFDSLLMTQIAKALSNQFQVDISFRQLFESTPDLGTLVRWLDETLPADSLAETDPMPVSDREANQADRPSSVTASAERTEAKQVPPMQALMMEQLQVLRAVMQTQLQMLGGSQSAGSEEVISSEAKADAKMNDTVCSGISDTRHPDATSLTNDDRQFSRAAKSKSSDAGAITAGFRSPVSRSIPAIPAQRGLQRQAKRTVTNAASLSQTSAKAFGAAARVTLSETDLSPEQQVALERFCRDYASGLQESKRQAQQHRRYLADPRTVSGFRPSMKEMVFPIVVQRSKGVHLWDVDGNRYVDLTCGFGSNLLGHGPDHMVQAMIEQLQRDYAIGPQTPLAGEVARLFCEITGSQRVAFANTGSEAVLGATRLARTFTGKSRIIMFRDDYHGILDEVIVRGSQKFKSFPASPGIPTEHVSNTLILEYGDPQSLEIIQNQLAELAAIVVEPVQSRRPELQPREFLQKLARITESSDTALILDEVITGLRIGPGGAQQHFGIKADLATYGKIVGGGMPIGMIAGKAKYMDGLDGGFWSFGDRSRPEAGMTYFAGTFCRHPVTMAAAKRILETIQSEGQPMYDRLNCLADRMAEQLNDLFKTLNAPMYLAHFGSLFKVQFQQESFFSELVFASLRKKGYFIWDNRPCLLNVQHNQEHIDGFVAAFRETILELQQDGFLTGEGHRLAPPATVSNRAQPDSNARLGKDQTGNPGWFISDPVNPGRFLQVSTSG